MKKVSSFSELLEKCDLDGEGLCLTCWRIAFPKETDVGSVKKALSAMKTFLGNKKIKKMTFKKTAYLVGSITGDPYAPRGKVIGTQKLVGLERTEIPCTLLATTADNKYYLHEDDASLIMEIAMFCKEADLDIIQAISSAEIDPKYL